jgi:hypothetical protein
MRCSKCTINQIVSTLEEMALVGQWIPNIDNWDECSKLRSLLSRFYKVRDFVA